MNTIIVKKFPKDKADLVKQLKKLIDAYDNDKVGNNDLVNNILYYKELILVNNEIDHHLYPLLGKSRMKRIEWIINHNHKDIL